MSAAGAAQVCVAGTRAARPPVRAGVSLAPAWSRRAAGGRGRAALVAEADTYAARLLARDVAASAAAAGSAGSAGASRRVRLGASRRVRRECQPAGSARVSAGGFGGAPAGGRAERQPAGGDSRAAEVSRGGTIAARVTDRTVSRVTAAPAQVSRGVTIVALVARVARALIGPAPCRARPHHPDQLSSSDPLPAEHRGAPPMPKLTRQSTAGERRAREPIRGQKIRVTGKRPPCTPG